MKLIPATLETLEALPQGAIISPIVDHYNDYVFLKHAYSGSEPWSDVGVSDGCSTSAVLNRCTSNLQTQLIQLWPDDDIDILKELQAQQDQLAQLKGKIASLDLSSTAADGSLRQLRLEHDGLTAKVFDSHVKQDVTNRNLTTRIDAVSERSSKEEHRLDVLLTQQQQLILKLESRLTALEQKP